MLEQKDASDHEHHAERPNTLSASPAAPNPPLSTACVAFTPPISTGTSSGSSTGSITSRARARTATAANNVASDGKPTSPSSSSAG